MISIIVGSENPVKLEAVRIAFATMFPDQDFSIQGHSVLSGQDKNPFGYEATLEGSITRAQNVKHLYGHKAHYYVGIEGGLKIHPGNWVESFGYATVIDQTPDDGQLARMNSGSTGGFFLPPDLGDKVIEAGHSGFTPGWSDYQGVMGVIGDVTNGEVDLEEFYARAVIFALVLFKNPNKY